MRAADSNVVVRYRTGDQPEQAARARDVFTAGQVFVSTTVILESDWVLRSGYGCQWAPKMAHFWASKMAHFFGDGRV